MSAEYDFYKNPIPKGSNRKPRLHARIVPRGVITTEMLSEEIHDASSLTTGDVEATITMLSKAIIRNLKQGKKNTYQRIGLFGNDTAMSSYKRPERDTGRIHPVQVGGVSSGNSVKKGIEYHPVCQGST